MHSGDQTQHCWLPIGRLTHSSTWCRRCAATGTPIHSWWECRWHGYFGRWTARRTKRSILKEINPEYSLERLILKLKFQYFGQLMWRADSLEKTLVLGKIEGRRGEVVGCHHWFNGHEFGQPPGDGEGQGSLACCSPWGCKEPWLSNSTTTTLEDSLAVPYKTKCTLTLGCSCGSVAKLCLTLWPHGL